VSNQDPNPPDADAPIPLEGEAPAPARTHAPAPAPEAPRVLCPYCGHIQPVTARCVQCKGLFDAESRQATQNAMGPWFVRNEAAPYHPGCSYATLKDLVRRGRITRETILRGPTTRQFWGMAANTPGVAVLLGECHACHQAANEDQYLCAGCGVVLQPRHDRQHLGLGAVRTVTAPAPHPPVAPSAPVPSIAPDAYSAAGPTPSSAPGTAFEPAVSGFAASALARRTRRDRARQTLLVLATAAMVVAVGVMVAIVLTRSPRPPARADAATAPSKPEPVPLGVRFAVELEEAKRLSAGPAPDQSNALSILRKVRAQVPDAPENTAFATALDDLIAKLRARIDDEKLNDLLTGTPASGSQPADPNAASPSGDPR